MQFRYKSYSRLTFLALSSLLVLSGSACEMNLDSEPGEEIFEGEEDPTAEFEDKEDEWLDEGPPDDDSPDTDDDTDYGLSLAAPPRFQLPFPCGQLWAGQTRTNHSPVRSIDFNRTNDYGDVVSAAAAGTVSRVGNTGSTSYGRWIEINHGNGFRTRYAHLSSQSVSTGQSVSRGQKIGRVGNTGGSTGAHLHYEQRYNGVAVTARFNGASAVYYGTRNYRSKNKCGGTSGASARVSTSGAPLTVRAGASTNTAARGLLANGSHVTITCQKYGQTITGKFGRSNIWNRIGNGYISDTYTYTGSDGLVAPLCN